jgi:putative tryptophan/tyrosine transport system substrate-binding protein
MSPWGPQMRRRQFISLLGTTLLAPIAAGAQQIGRTYRLGVLLPLTQHAPINVAFLDELRRGGFIEGQNLAVEWRAFAEHFDRMSLYAAELVKARVDVIATATDEAIRALQQVTNTIPIVAITDDMLGSVSLTRWRDRIAIQQVSISSGARATANDRTS